MFALFGRSKISGQEGTIDQIVLAGERFRGRLFRPVLKSLDSIGLTANGITNVRCILSVCFGLIFHFVHPIAGAVLFIVILSLDMFDGALARFQGLASHRGKILDICVDHFAYVIMLFQFIGLGANFYYVGLNLISVPFAYFLGIQFKIAQAESRHSRQFFPKLSFLKSCPILAFFSQVFAGINFLDFAIVVSSVIAFAMMAIYYFGMQLHWKIRASTFVCAKNGTKRFCANRARLICNSELRCHLGILSIYGLRCR